MTETDNLPELQFAAVQAVVNFAAAGRGDPQRDDQFYDAVREEFPLVIASRAATQNQPPPAPHIVVGSNVAQLAVGPTQADLLFQFPDDDARGIEPGLAAVTRALTAAIRGIRAGGYDTDSFGVVATTQRSTFKEPGISPAEQVLRHQLRADTDPTRIQDAMARIGLRVADRYFVNLQVQSYESRQIGGQMMFAFPRLVHPWEGVLVDQGVQLIIDVNTFLEARLRHNGVPVSEEAVTHVTGLLHTVLIDIAPRFLETGALPVDALDAVVNG